MSDIPADWRGQLDIREQIARIDAKQAELQKLLAETPKLQAETNKYNRDLWVLALVALIAAFATIVAGVFARLPEILTAMGLPH